MNIKKLYSLVKAGEKKLKGRDLEFCRRVWKTDLEVYQNRLKAAGFKNKGKALDGGCGFGQWSLCLSELNRCVYSIDK